MSDVVTVADLGPLITIGVEDLGGIPVEAATPVVSGPRGRSAYQVAVDEGFVGTVEEWLASLHGEDGDDGDDGAGAVSSVNGHDGDVVLDASDIGADPAGTAQQLVDDLWTQIAGGNLDAALDTLKEIGDRLEAGGDTATALAAQIAAVSGTLTALAGTVGGKADAGTVAALTSALATHKSSGDHDARYYTQSQVDDAIETAIEGVPDPDLTPYATKADVGDLEDLETTEKSTVVAAVNEVKNAVPVIDGYTISAVSTEDPATDGGTYEPGDPDYGDNLPGIGDPPFIWLRIIE